MMIMSIESGNALRLNQLIEVTVRPRTIGAQ